MCFGSLHPNDQYWLTQWTRVVLYVSSMEGAASVYGGVGDIQERENNQMVSVLSQAKDPDLTPAENAAKMTALLGRLSCWNNEVQRRIDAKNVEGLYCHCLIVFKWLWSSMCSNAVDIH